MNQMKITTERLILRSWKEKDIQSLANLYADPRVMEYSDKIKTFDESFQEYKNFVSSIEKNGWGFLAVELKNTQKFIGLIGLENISFQSHFTPAVEIGWRLHYDFWGKGFATEGAKACLKYGFEALNLNEIVAFTFIENWRSRKVMERLKMTYDSKDDFYDPDLPKNHPLSKLVLYRMNRTNWNKIVC